MKFKLHIVHFNPYEFYPPIQNFIAILEEKKCSYKLYTTGRNIESNKRIKYFKNYFKSNIIIRLVSYLWFTLSFVLNCMKEKPKAILYYETISCLPVYIVYRLFKPKIYIHFHEYNPRENKRDGKLVALNAFFESYLITHANQISQTNSFRMEFYKEDNKEYLSKNTRFKILPNYPPSSWHFDTQLKKSFSDPIRLISIGSINEKDFYLSEIERWLENQNGRFYLDIFSFAITKETKDIINNSKYLTFRGSIKYTDIPIVLKDYDIGLILYKSDRPNVVYSASNKLFEYHALGLDVWFPSHIIGSEAYIQKDHFPKILSVDYNDLDSLQIESILERKNLPYQPSTFFASSIYNPLIDEIFNS